MKTTMIPLHIDMADLARLKEQLPDLSKMEMPKLEGVGKTADETIDRLLGRSRMRVWPWVAASIGLVAIVGAVTAAFMWLRRPPMDTTIAPLHTPDVSAFTDEPVVTDMANLDDLATGQSESERVFRGDEAV